MISKYCKGISRFYLLTLVMCIIFSISAPMVFADPTNGDLNGVGAGTTATETTTVTTPVTTPVVEQTPSTQTTVPAQTQTTVPAQTQTQNTTTTNIIGDMPGSSLNQKEVEDTAAAVGNMFNNVGPKEEDIEQANAFIAPIADIMNKVMAVILGITSLLMMLITILDLLYMAFPPIRDILDGGRQGMGNMMAGGRGSRGMGGGMRGMGMCRGMGMGGMGMGGMGGMGMAGGMGGPGMGMGGGMQQPQQMGGGLSAVGRWVSDEAIAACLESQGGVMQGQMGMGGTKNIVLSYMKKRALFLILFGVCVVLFTSTVFTDLGVRLGTWLLKMIMGFGA